MSDQDKPITLMSQEHIDATNKVLDQYEQDIAGLPPNDKIELDRLVYQPFDVLRKKDPEELAGLEFNITQYMLYLQRVINRNNSWIRWAKNKLDEACTVNIPNIDKRYGYNERELLAKNSGDVCIRINKFIRDTQIRNDNLYDIPSNLHVLRDSIRSMRFIALKREKEYENYE